MKGSGTPVWDDLASRFDLAALSPGTPMSPPSSVDVLVVGGGVIGLAVAAECTSRGMDVLVVERERCAAGPSGRAGGFLAPDWHPEQGEVWHAAARRSFELHGKISAGADTGLRSLDLRLLGGEVIAEQGHLDPIRFAAVLARKAGTVLTGVTDDAIDVAFGHVVYATGVAPLEAGIAGQSWVKGHLIATEPVGRVLNEITVSVRDGVLAVQLPSGHILAGGTKEPDVSDPTVDDGVVAHITGALERMCGVVPAVAHAWTCFRPLAAEERPVVRRDGNVFVAAGFYSSGILMAPVTGEIIADAIESGADPAPIA